MSEVSELDLLIYKMIRDNVSNFISSCGKKYDKEGTVILDIAPQIHEGAAPHFKKSTIETLDIDKDSKPTYIADICKNNRDKIPANRFDYVICTEVLEHTLQPFEAVEEIYRILKPGGRAFVSVPFNFRIHGPLPDCWRFTEHGLRALFNKYKIVELNALETEDRFLMPAHYTLIAEKHYTQHV